jgi:hypothetical protein
MFNIHLKSLICIVVLALSAQSAFGLTVQSFVTTPYLESCEGLHGFSYAMKSFTEGKLPAYKAEVMEKLNSQHEILLDQVAVHARVRVDGPTVLQFKSMATDLPTVDQDGVPVRISNATFSTFADGIFVKDNAVHVVQEGPAVLEVDLTVIGICRFYSGEVNQLYSAVTSAIQDAIE